MLTKLKILFRAAVLPVCTIHCLCSAAAHAQELLPSHRYNQLFVGGELERIERNRAGGAKQHGWLGGAQLIYRHIRPLYFYWGVEAAHTLGPLRGHNAWDMPLKSTFSETYVEGQVGYTLGSECYNLPTLTAYVGGGNMWERNNFKKSSPLPLHFTIRYPYALGGVLLNFWPIDSLSIGCHGKVRYMVNPRCTISHDPHPASDYHGVHLKVGNDQVQYRIELPISYTFGCGNGFALTTIPFYEKRLYGEHNDFPFNFNRTTISEYGLVIGVTYAFDNGCCFKR
jgi:hypothetical protein